MNRHMFTYTAAIIWLTLFCSVAHAEKPFKFCVNWQLKYDDMNQGEDLLNKSSASIIKDGSAWVRVPHAIYRIYNEDGDKIKSGRLDDDGCATHDLVPESGSEKKYTLRVWYGVEDNGGRAFNVLDDDSKSWSTKPQIYKQKILFLPTTQKNMITMDMYIKATKYSRVVPVVSHMIERASLLEWPPNTRVAFAVNNSNLCKKTDGSYFINDKHSLKKICMQGTSDGEYKASKTCKSRIILGHETGHALAAANSGPNEGDYTGDASGGARYTDDDSHCHSGDGDSHHFNSREWIGAAAMEGYAHFISAANLNNRAPDGWYPTNGWRRYDISSNKMAEVRLAPDSNGEWPGYINTWCRPPSKYRHLGSEVDWLLFFWGLWTTGGDSRFDIEEINDVWKNTSHKNAYCVPRTTTETTWIYTHLAAGYEEGWTCKDKYWEWSSPFMVPAEWINGGGYTLVPAEYIRAKKHNRGESYEALYETVEANYPDKLSFFNDTAINAKVVYTY
ncbi:MAG: hypothetical protein JXX14_23980 [Deltaproteobacteria bacterium]|nr:hypothetical protein [Deltaproteobacteria bacterium]